MTIRNASRVVTLTTLAAGVLISCSDSTGGGAITTGGSGGSSSGSGGSAGMATTTAGSPATAAGTSSTAGTPASAGMGGMGGSTGGTGGAAGAAGSSAGTAPGTAGQPPVVVVPQVCNVNATGKGEGHIAYERWLDEPGTTMGQLMTVGAPDFTALLTEMKQGGTNLENFGARMRGILTAPLAGKYRFWVAGDDNVVLYLSTSEAPDAKVKIASIEGADSGWTNDLQWDKFTSQKSQEITLEADKKYYVEVLHKEGVNLDHVSVGWQLPGESGLMPCEIVPGSVLTPIAFQTGEGGSGGEGGGAQ